MTKVIIGGHRNEAEPFIKLLQSRALIHLSDISITDDFPHKDSGLDYSDYEKKPFT